jgi:antitoxin ParD1/3/4
LEYLVKVEIVIGCWLAQASGKVVSQGVRTMPKETTLRLENYFLAFIEDQIAKGRFSSPSAVVQAGLRLLEESESHADALAAALQEGEDSGLSEHFDFDEFLARKNTEVRERESAEKA